MRCDVTQTLGIFGMSPSGEQPPREIHQDLPCPGCGYNLRGLAGDVVSCPECGQSCDVAQLSNAGNVLSWRLAPGLGILTAPAVWLLLAPTVTACLIALTLSVFQDALPWPRNTDDACLVFLGLGAVVIAPVWGWLMYRAWRYWPGAVGVGLALLAHVVVVAYVAGAYVGVSELCLLGAVSRGGWVPVLALVFPVACVLLWWAGNRGYRYLAERCILRRLCGAT